MLNEQMIKVLCVLYPSNWEMG